MRIYLQTSVRLQALGLFALTSCGPEEPELEYIDVGVDVRLNAVAEGDWQHFVAVGSGGVIVDDDGQTWDFGPAELRDVAWFEEGNHWRWAVVGDQGLVLHAVHAPPPIYTYEPEPTVEWTTIDAGTTANLHAVEFWEGWWLVVAGDDTLRVSEGWYGPDFSLDHVTWFEPTPPPGGWGRLRTLFVGPGPRLWAAGEQGRLLWAEGHLQGALEQWHVEDVNTKSNLRAGGAWNGHTLVVGDEGTVLIGSPGALWTIETLHPQYDLLGVGFRIISSDQTIRRLLTREGKLESEVFARFDWQPRAIGEHYIVGDDGNVVYYCNCEPVD